MKKIIPSMIGFAVAFLIACGAFSSTAQVLNPDALHSPINHEAFEADTMRLYGMTFWGGAFGAGTIYRVKADGSDFTVLHNFTGDINGSNPIGALIRGVDGALYGMTYSGGVGDINGTIFKINTDGGSHRVVHKFTRPNGANPIGSLIQGLDGLLYGMTYYGDRTGIFGNGIIFKVKTDGTGYTVLHKFEGGNPYGSLVQLPDSSLCGMTYWGGVFGEGTIFKIKTDGSGYEVIYDFNDAGGHTPNGALLIGSDGALYGVAQMGGAFNFGTVFKIGADGTHYEVLHDFNISMGAVQNSSGTPQGTLVQATDGTLYGMTYDGGSFGRGTIYTIHADGGGFRVLYSFDEPFDSSSGPQGNSLTLHENKLFGCNHAGIIFSYDLATSAYAALSGGHNTGTQYASLLPLNIDGSRDVFITTPGNGAVNQNIRLNVTANEISGATNYTIQVSPDAAFGKVKEKSGGHTLFFDSLNYNTTYFARAKTDLRNSYGRITRFTTARKDFFSFVSYPPNHALDVRTFNLNLTVTAVPGATTYTIQLSESADFSTIDFEVSGATRTLVVSGLKYNTVYYSRVHTNLSSEFGETRSFATRTAESRAFVVTPADHAVNVDVARNITSNVVPGAMQYTIQLSADPDFSSIDFELTGSSITLPVRGLKFNTTYYNRVLTDKSTTYGEVRSFTTRTAESQTYVTFPANGATGVATKLNIVSKEVPYATQYVIQLSRQPDFSVIDFERIGATRNLAFSGLTQGTTYYNRVRTDASPAFGPVRSFATGAPSSARIALGYEAENQPGESDDFKVMAYPNPFTQKLVVYIESVLDETVEIELHDVNGSVVYQSSEATNSEIEINHTGNSGVYFLRASSATVNKWVRVVKVE